MMHPRTEMIDGLDDILDSDRVFGSDAPSDRDDLRLGWVPCGFESAFVFHEFHMWDL